MILERKGKRKGFEREGARKRGGEGGEIGERETRGSIERREGTTGETED